MHNSQSMPLMYISISVFAADATKASVLDDDNRCLCISDVTGPASAWVHKQERASVNLVNWVRSNFGSFLSSHWEKDKSDALNRTSRKCVQLEVLLTDAVSCSELSTRPTPAPL